MTTEEIQKLGKILSHADNGCSGCVETLLNLAIEEFRFTPDEITFLMDGAAKGYWPGLFDISYNAKEDKIEVGYK